MPMDAASPALERQRVGRVATIRLLPDCCLSNWPFPTVPIHSAFNARCFVLIYILIGDSPVVRNFQV